MIYALLAILPLSPPVRDSLPIDTANVVVGRHDFALAGGFSRSVAPHSGGSATVASQLVENGVYLKQYGYTGLATISLRGADPQQTQVLWNGIPISSPMLGMVDLNNVGAFGNDNVHVLNSGAGSFYGSGNVGGSVLLMQQKPASLGFGAEAVSAYSTYGNSQFGADLTLAKERFYVRNSASLQSGNNNFNYRLNPEGALSRMQSARNNFFTERFIVGGSLKKLELKSIAEYTDNMRELGVVPGSGKTAGVQWDKSLRLLVESAYSWKNAKWTWRNARIADFIRFADSNVNMDDSSNSVSWFSQMEMQFTVRKWRLLMGGDYQQSIASAPAYIRRIQAIYPASFAAAFLAKNHWEFSANSRYEWHEKVPVFGIFVKNRVAKKFKLFAGLHTAFRRPTFNDIFWGRDTALTLQSERGGSIESGFNSYWQWGKHLFNLDGVTYFRSLLNPIIWMPQGNNWIAVNKYRGDYSGMQLGLKYAYELRTHTFKINLNYDYVSAWITEEREAIAFRRIFVPEHNGSLWIQWQHGSWNASINHRYTALRYITTDNLVRIPGFWIADFYAGYQRLGAQQKAGLEAGFQIENIWNTTYQVMPGRPMPLRGLKIVLRIKFKQ